jgi:hypothetical protein
VLDRQLGGHDRRAAAMPVVDDLQQIARLIEGDRGETPVVVCGRPPMASTFLALRTIWSAAVICPACWCGAFVRGP